MRYLIEAARLKGLDRIAIAYAVSAWVVVQAASIAAPAYAWPPWVLQLTILLALLGLPVVLIGAWARTAELDKMIVTALSKARQAVVKGMPQKGPGTTDVYRLAGFAKELAAIDKACGVQREEKPKTSAAPQHGKRKAKKSSH